MQAVLAALIRQLWQRRYFVEAAQVTVALPQTPPHLVAMLALCIPVGALVFAQEARSWAHVKNRAEQEKAAAREAMQEAQKQLVGGCQVGGGSRVAPGTSSSRRIALATQRF